jgi:hypothetical protein
LYVHNLKIQVKINEKIITEFKNISKHLWGKTNSPRCSRIGFFKMELSIIFFGRGGALASRYRTLNIMQTFDAKFLG